jgi:excisionase family DNA binding protein
MNRENSTQMLSIPMVSERTSLSRSTLYREIDSGRLKVVKIGKSVRITEQALQEYIKGLENKGMAI